MLELTRYSRAVAAVSCAAVSAKWEEALDTDLGEPDSDNQDAL
jgi:hypothetical protein